ncbi:MAG TPA: hypothetical protein DEB06_05365 [Phycisphaerales bacterium]|nr:hypothetical protein [Phycisphaerales bacterium]
MQRVVPAAVTMIAYALTLLAIGTITYLVALPGSGALTALLIPALGGAAMTVCAVLALRIGSNRTLGMVGIHAGLALPLVLALGSGLRLRASMEKAQVFNDQVRSAPVAVSAVTRDTRDEPRPLGYQAVGIGAIASVSVFAFIALVCLRPRPGPKATEPDASGPAPEENNEGRRPSDAGPDELSV